MLSESGSREELVATSRIAGAHAGRARLRHRRADAPRAGPVALRSTGASVALAGNPGVIAALAAADLVIDCTVEGLLHAPELGEILGGGARVLMVSNEHPENFERYCRRLRRSRPRGARRRAARGGRRDAGDLGRGHRPHGQARRRVPRGLSRASRRSPARSPTGRAASAWPSRRPTASRASSCSRRATSTSRSRPTSASR